MAVRMGANRQACEVVFLLTQARSQVGLERTVCNLPDVTLFV